MTKEEKQYFIKIVNGHYPDFLLTLSDVFLSLMDALAPILTIIAEFSNMIWQSIAEHFSKEQIDELLKLYGPGTNSETTDSK